MSVYSDRIENIIESLQNNDVTEKKEKKISINLNSHSREFKNIQFRSHKYKNSQVLKKEKEKVNEEDKVKKYLDDDQINVFKRPWNKLENGFKKNRVLLFIDEEVESKNLSIKEKIFLKNLLYNAIDNKELNTKNLVEYDQEKCIIEKINILDYDEENGYSLNIKKKKNSIKKNNIEDKKINIIDTLKKKTESNRKKREEEKNKIQKNLENI